MKLTTSALTAGACLIFASQAFAQDSGVSHPENLKDDIVVAAPPNSTVTVTPPAPALQTRPAEARPEVYESYKAYRPAGPVQALPADPDAGIVAAAPYSDDALSPGTLLKTHLVGQLSTESTRPGSHFIATLSQPVEHNGRIILPAGASLEGRVSSVRSGRRISGGAAMHLVPETVTLPDGTLYHLNAQVVDVDGGHGAHVNDEGTIVGGNHNKGHAVTMAATTGGGAVAGAVLGGGVGAAVGAGVGAGVGGVLWLRQDREQTLLEGTELIFSLNDSMRFGPAPSSH